MSQNVLLNVSHNKAVRCLVLGGNGFIGAHLVSALHHHGYTVTIFDRPNTLLRHHALKIPFIAGDMTHKADLANALMHCDVCFHLVSTTLPHSSNTDPFFDIETNLKGSLLLLEHAVRANVKKIIFASSGGTVYGIPQQVPIDEAHPTNPICAYGITKLAIEKYLHLYHQLYGLDYTILRLSNPFGEWQKMQSTQGVIAVCLGKILCQEPVEIWGDGSVVRDYIYIADVIDAMLAAISYDGPEHIFNIGSGYGMNIHQMLEIIEQIIDKPIQRLYREKRMFDVPCNVLSIQRARQILRWQPQTTFAESIRRMIRHYASHYRLNI